ncbi:MAG: hypothetical protein AMXMBFR56_69580 [Polyangiaceae bacterium]
MRSYVAAFVVAAAVAVLLTPLVRLLALRIGAVSGPGGRHVNAKSIPRLGGIAIALSFSAPLIALFLVDSGVARIFRESQNLALGLLFGGCALCLVGVVDDTRGVRALYKLAAQVAAASIAFALGFQINAVHVPGVGELSMGIFALPITVVWIVGVTNAVNLIDGLDGLAAGVVFFAAVTNLVVAYLSGSVLVAVLMSAMMGSLVGFLFHNFNPARIFMGDSGSYFLGFVLATTSLAGSMQKASTAVSLLVPIVALGVPIFDTLFSMVRRILERRSVFSPDRGHIHHRLLDMGITHRRAVLILYGVSIVLTVAAIGIALGRSWEIGAALLAVTVVMIGLVRFVGYFEYLHLRKRQKAHLYDRHTEKLRRELPRAQERLAAAESAEDVWSDLAKLAEACDLAYVAVLSTPQASEQEVYRHDRSGVGERDLVSARFFVGREASARICIKFGWRSETEDVPPQADILMQVAADLVESALVRLGSNFAPRRDVAISEAPLETARLARESS